MHAFLELCHRLRRHRFRSFADSFFGARSPRRHPRPTPRPFSPSIAALVQVLEPRVCLAVPLELAVPQTVYGVVGEPAAMVFENLIPTLTADGFRFEFQCDIGTVTDKQWTVIPQSEDIGDHAWQIAVWQGDVLVDSQSGVFRVTSANFDAGRGYNLLMVGDSLTHASTHVNIMAEQFSAEERDVTFVGTHHPSFAIPGVNHEGYGGWTWNRFRTYYEPDPNLAQKRYVSPFVFLEEGQTVLNVPRYYQERLAGQKPDYVMFLLGVNDLISTKPDNLAQLDLRINQTLTAAELLIQAFRAASPETEIGICLTTPPNARESAFTINYAGRLTRENWKPVQHRLVEGMLQRFEGREKERIFVVPTGMNLDPMLSFPENNAVHPNPRGYGELAGSIRGWLLSRMQPQPPELESTTLSIPENAAVGSLVGRLQLANFNSNRPPQFAITGGPFADAFAIDAVSGEIRVVHPDVLDFETNPTLDLAISILDPYVVENSAEVTVTVQLRDENEAPTTVSLQNVVSSLDEMTDTNARTKLAEIAVFDDAGGNNIITLTGDAAAAFEVDAGTLYLKAGTILDFESKSDYVVNIQIDDEAVGLTPDLSTTFVLRIANVFEPPPSLTLLNVVTTLVENTPTEAPVKVAEIVFDASLTAALVLSGADADHFEIADGALFLRAGTPLDFETRTEYAVTVTLDADKDSDARVDFVLSVTNVNEQPSIILGPNPLVVGDNATMAPLAHLVLADPDTQALLIQITIVNGVQRGDLTPQSTVGWTRTVSGNDFVYERTIETQPDMGAMVQPALRGLIFQPRANVLKPNTTELTELRITVNDGETSTTTSLPLTTLSANDAPLINGASAAVAVNDNATINPFSTMTVFDPDFQQLLISVTILNGLHRGDFTNALDLGWTTRQVVGNNITYRRHINPTVNVGTIAEAALRALIFQPRSNAIKPGLTERTDFQVTASDGVEPATINVVTRVTTTSVNDAPTTVGTTTSVFVDDNASVNPFSALTVADRDMQEMLLSVTILNGIHRGDFTNALSSGWTVRQVAGNNITYKRYFSPTPNVGAIAEAAFRALTFQPRSNALKPGITELTDFQVTVSDGVAVPQMDRHTRVTTVSVNQAPTVNVAMANQNANGPIVPFNTLTVTDPDAQDLLVRVTIINGLLRGDFRAATTLGWTRRISSGNIVLERFFGAAPNNGARVQTALRELVFEPRHTIPAGTQETTNFTVFINDGLATMTDSTTNVVVRAADIGRIGQRWIIH